MAPTLAILSAVLTFTSAVTAQVTCDGFRTPNWGDCEYLKTQMDSRTLWQFGPESMPCIDFIPPDADVDPNSLNCKLQACQRDGLSNSAISGGSLNTLYTLISANCRKQEQDGAGGYGSADNFGDLGVMYILANPDFIPGLRRSTNTARGLPDPPVNETDTTHMQTVHPTLDRRITPFEEAVHPVSARRHARELFDRQEEEETYDAFITSYNVEMPNGRIPVFGPSPSGSLYTVTESRAETNSVVGSVGTDTNLFDVFTASVGIEIGYEETITETVGVTQNITCERGQRGIVYWIPLYTYYEGTYRPSGTSANWYVAQNNDQTSYDIQCIQ